MLEALVFDFDGVILDTETPLFEAWARLYREYGHVLPIEKWAANVGGYAYDVFDPYVELEQRTGRSLDREALKMLRRQWYLGALSRQGMAQGLPKLLDAARNRGWKLGVASSSDREWVHGHLSRLELADRFDAVACGDEVERVKPDPAVYHLCLRRLGVESCATAALEDSPRGIAAARAANIYCVTVPNPVTRAMDLSGAHWLVPSLDAYPPEQFLDEVAARHALSL